MVCVVGVVAPLLDSKAVTFDTKKVACFLMFLIVFWMDSYDAVSAKFDSLQKFLQNLNSVIL